MFVCNKVTCLSVSTALAVGVVVLNVSPAMAGEVTSPVPTSEGDSNEPSEAPVLQAEKTHHMYSPGRTMHWYSHQQPENCPPTDNPTPPVTPPTDNPTPPVTPPTDNPTPPATPPTDNPTPPVTPPTDNPTPPVTPPTDNPTPPHNAVPPISPPSTAPEQPVPASLPETVPITIPTNQPLNTQMRTKPSSEVPGTALEEKTLAYTGTDEKMLWGSGIFGLGLATLGVLLALLSKGKKRVR